jgi:hypothetical protein
MAKNLEDETIRMTSEEIPATTAEELARMLAIPDEAIDTSDIPERRGPRRRLQRDGDGRLPGRQGVIRETIAAAMAERDLTVYALWKEAKAHCPTISETAVGDFLKGRRSIGIDYLEAIMHALGLTIVPIGSIPAAHGHHAAT